MERERWEDIETGGQGWGGRGERQWKHPFEQMMLILFKALAAQSRGPVPLGVQAGTQEGGTGVVEYGGTDTVQLIFFLNRG